MKSRMLPCELCGREVAIRSRIKDGEHKGKKACGACVGSPGLKKVNTSSGTNKRRKEQRKDLPAFFATAIQAMQEKPVCQNCGAPIKAWFNPTWNIAHILKKSVYKSVATHPENFVILCAHKDEQNNCHEKFDGALSNRINMPVFNLALQKFVKLKDDCLERGKEYFIFEENI